jgi:hypothetical protein
MQSTNERVFIDLEVHSVARLLDEAGSPLVGPRIHPVVAHAIRAQAEAAAKGSRFQIRITVPEDDIERRSEVESAVNQHFLEESRDADFEVKKLGEKGRRGFVIAFFAVGLFLILSELFLRIGDGRLPTILSESMIIVAWVILWGPADTLLLARLPVRRVRDLAKSLAISPVTLLAKA